MSVFTLIHRLPMSEKDRVETPTSEKSPPVAVRAVPIAHGIFRAPKARPRQKMHGKCIDYTLVIP